MVAKTELSLGTNALGHELPGIFVRDQDLARDEKGNVRAMDQADWKQLLQISMKNLKVDRISEESWAKMGPACKKFLNSMDNPCLDSHEDSSEAVMDALTQRMRGVAVGLGVACSRRQQRVNDYRIDEEAWESRSQGSTRDGAGSDAGSATSNATWQSEGRSQQGGSSSSWGNWGR